MANKKTILIDKPSLIYIKNRKLLMARSKGQTLFCIPGGKREAGESVEDALIREVSEELNVKLIKTSFNELFTVEAQAYGKPEGVLIRHTCIAAEVQGEPSASSEIDELRYLSSTDKHLTPHAGILILNKLHKMNLID